MERATVLQKIGPPDSQTIYKVTHIPSQTTYKEPYIDVYEPGPGDEQTRTKITYAGQTVTSISREAAR
ncbi:hypothetical protein DSM104443_00604 [Usitatibacter rugosus]|uniref:Uncharacterized protein n=1 Tax=Usitatibacter rugosus TaxID=2732067 RepID=A0A6M4GR67_9PROT|nr:hypothetical protein [Usitatibacter rugosus]QJR09555.1 hypothetical protein DSM104443_00604 [Usitatibacter rugosus]